MAWIWLRRVIWRVGDGAAIKAWRSPWIPRGHDYLPVTPKRYSRFNRVFDFLDNNGAWNMERLEEHFWPMDIHHILKIRTSPRNRHDFLAWPLKRMGDLV